jgi:hypothetical protein
MVAPIATVGASDCCGQKPTLRSASIPALPRLMSRYSMLPAWMCPTSRRWLGELYTLCQSKARSRNRSSRACLAQSMSLPTACLVPRRSIAENFIGNPLLLVRERVVERLKSRGQSLHVLCVLFRDRGVGIQIIHGAHLAKPLGPLHQPLFHVAGIVPHDLSEIVPLGRLSRRNLQLFVERCNPLRDTLSGASCGSPRVRFIRGSTTLGDAGCRCTRCWCW